MAKRDSRRARPKAAHKQKARKNKSQQRGPSHVASIRITPHNIDEAMRAAVQLHHAGQLADAEHVYRRVLRLQPDHPDALNSLAMIEYAAERFDTAVALLRRAVDLIPDNPGYRMNLAVVEDAAGDARAAEQSYQRAIALAPTYADPYYNLGDLYLRQDKPDAAIEVFDRCMATIGREFHALAYKAHALIDAGRTADAAHLLDFDTYVKRHVFEAPDGFEDMASFNAALAEHITKHPTLQANVMSTEHGKHTGELLRDPSGPMAAMEVRIHQAVRWYTDRLPDDPEHPAVRWAPKIWKLTTWGVVMHDRGHERAHIHPNGWLSGVFYLELPDLINDPERKPEGWLEFGRPTGELHVKSELRLRHFQPAYGQMFLFPSYFYHGTVPFRSKQRRICVSFDVEPV